MTSSPEATPPFATLQATDAFSSFIHAVITTTSFCESDMIRLQIQQLPHSSDWSPTASWPVG